MLLLRSCILQEISLWFCF